jgi:ABC-type multidrug transport system permease subunit
MTRSASVAVAITWRMLKRYATTPNLLVPSLVFPLFFFIAFAGGLSSVSRVPGFDFPSGYTAFQFVFVFVQSSAFGGVFTGFGIATDFENGFSRRLMLAAPNRLAILAGYTLGALVRALITGVLLFGVALVGGMQVDGGVLGIAGLVGLAIVAALAAALFAAGVAMRLRTIQAGPAMQMPVFILLFIAPVYVPLALLTGWVKTVAHVNPVTPLLDNGRDFISGGHADLALVAGVGAALIAVFGVWAVRGLRSAESAG